MTTVAPPPGGDFPWAILIAALGVGVNFVFNVVNYVRTTSLKKRDVRLDEFKRLRARLDQAVSDIRADQTALGALSRSAGTKAKWGKELVALNKRLVENYFRMNAALADMSSSPFVSGMDWSAVPEQSWARAVNSIDGGYSSTKTLAVQKASISDAATHLGSMIDAVNHRINDEMGTYASRANRIT